MVRLTYFFLQSVSTSLPFIVEPSFLEPSFLVFGIDLMYYSLRSLPSIGLFSR